MKKICFGKNITTVNSRMSNLTDNIKSSLREVYRFPQNLVDVSNCFNGCVNLTKFEAELPNTIKNMSSSFEGCGNFYKNVAIPSDCIDMSRSFKGAGIKGSINIPDKVVDMRESFKDSKLEAVSFNENISHFNNFQESFVNCKTLAYIYGNLPQNIVNAGGSFKNTGITEVNFFRENSFVNDGKDMFKGCSNLKSSSVDLNINYANDIFNGCYQLQTVKNIYTEVMDNSFKDCRNLKTIGNIKGNSFSNSWNGCSNLQTIGIISGNLNFNNSFNGCSNYSNVVYLNPNSINDSNQEDYEFLASHPLRIYGRGHGYDIEMKFQNSHNLKGDYISGYCDPDEFDTSSNSDYSFGAYKGNTENLVIPRYMRKNLLDDSTKYIPNFYQSFNGKNFSEVKIYGNSKFSTNCFANQSTSFMNILDNPDFYIDSDGTNSCFGDVNSIGLKNCHVEFHGGDTTPVFANSGVMSFNNSCSISNIKDYSFSGCFSLNSLGTNSEHFLSKIDVFGDGSFKDCNNLSMIINISNASVVGNEAFKNVEKSTMIQFPSSPLIIYNNAFNGCYGVRNISNIAGGTFFPHCFYNIGKTKDEDGNITINAINDFNISSSSFSSYSYAFSNFYIKNMNTPIFFKSLFGSWAPSTLYNVVHSGTGTLNLSNTYVKNVTLLINQSYNFQDLSYLEEINAPSGFSIGGNVLKNCPNLETIKGKGVFTYSNSFSSYIGPNSFGTGLNNLRNLNIATSVTIHYNNSTFGVCPNLTNLFINGNLHPYYDYLIYVPFKNCNNLQNVGINGYLYGSGHIGQLWGSEGTARSYYTNNTSSPSWTQLYNSAINNIPSGMTPTRIYKVTDAFRYWNSISDSYKYGYNHYAYISYTNLQSVKNITIGSVEYFCRDTHTNTSESTTSTPLGLVSNMPNLQYFKGNVGFANRYYTVHTGLFANNPKMNYLHVNTTIDMLPYNWFSYYSNGICNTNSSLQLRVNNSLYTNPDVFLSGVQIWYNGTKVK